MAALVMSSAAFSQSTNYLEQWKTLSESWKDVNNSWQDITNDTLPQGVVYFCDTSTVAGTNHLYHSLSNLYPETGTITWSYSVLCSVKNSSVNNFKIYLIANDTVPGGDNYSAFAIGTGLKTGIYPQLCLLKYSGKDLDILATTDIMFDNTINNKVLTITRTSTGEWTINGEPLYQEPEPQMYIADYTTIEYKHSTTGNGAFNIRPLALSFEHTGNTIDAKMFDAEIVGDGVVNVSVDGRLNAESAMDVNNYQLNGSKPDSIHFLGVDVTLFFNRNVFNNTVLELSATNIKQTVGNVMPDFNAVLYLPQYGGIVINEIMCDVSPAPANLPAAKYIELFNSSKYPFSLKNCAMLAGDYRYYFPETEIAAGEYLLICRSNELDSYAPTVTKFDDSKIITKDRKLTLLNQAGYIVDSLTYTLDMYGDKAKSSGGYSLERRDPKNLFTIDGNWTASLDISGGTPGRVNSTLTTVTDNIPPRVISTSVVNNNTINIVFSKNITADAAKFLLNGNAATECSANLNNVSVVFSTALNEGDNVLKVNSLSDFAGNLSADTTVNFQYYRLKLLNVYSASNYQLCFEFNNDLNLDGNAAFYAELQPHSTVNVNGSTAFVSFDQGFTPDVMLNASAAHVKDIYGNVIDSISTTFAYHNAERFDLLITEVLYYPLSGAKRFVEIYNNTKFSIPLNQYSIVYYDNSGAQKQSVINGNYLLLPEHYAVITQDTTEIQERYTCGGLFVQDTKLPAFANTQGSIVLRSPSGAAIDSMYYNRTESNTLEINVQGVSIERVGFNQNSTDLAAWKFATSAVDYATPGLPNSHIETPDTDMPDGVTIVNELFTPDGDGYKDEVEIQLSFSTDDTAVDIRIYDSNGILRTTLASRTNIGSSASFYWNGVSDNGSLCKSGIYVIYIKTISPDGKTDVYKKVCVLSRK